MRLIKFEPGTVFGEKAQRRYSQGPLRRIAKVYNSDGEVTNSSHLSMR
jgi:hypothetical protein